MKPILLFDIDGTLLHVKKLFIQELIHTIMKDLGLNRDKLSAMPFAGRTDKDIFNDIAGRLTNESDKKEELFEEIKDAYLKVLLRDLASDHVDLIEGVSETVHVAVENNLDVGLCTGNFREAAHKKIEAAGLTNLFFFGGFGCEHADRKHLPEAAHLEYVKFSGSEPERKAYVIIGDTPNDIRSAKYFGARSVAVTTGSFSSEDLKVHKPDKLVENLRELIPVYITS
ncbi:MAG TPA: HAD hydrolase-like protein [Balneolaceae bacterium]|nr:HAD hydrolase-like protein [Balneolaceae bacterium]